MRRDYEGACGTKGPNDATDRAAGTDEAGSKSGRTNQRRTAASFPPSPARGGGRNGVSEPIAAARRRAHGSSAEVAWHPVFVGHSSASGADFGFRHSIRRTQRSGPHRSRPRRLDRMWMISGPSLRNDHAPGAHASTSSPRNANDASGATELFGSMRIWSCFEALALRHPLSLYFRPGRSTMVPTIWFCRRFPN